MTSRAVPQPFELRPSPIHGTGAFATRDLTRGVPVLEYVGRPISKAESRRQRALNNPFLFYLDGATDLDGNVPENSARFLNHSCAPNCQAERMARSIWIVTLRDIRRGEELTFDYGYDLEDFREHPCHCGAPSCTGFILAAEFRGTVAPRAARG